MKLALLGVGNAGVRLVDELRGAEQRTQTPISDGNVLAFNTTPSTFAELEHIDESRQVLIGDTHPEVYQPEAVGEEGEIDKVDTESVDPREGVAGDPELGAAVAREDLPEIRRALDAVDDTEVDAAMIVAGLGGGTGCGVGSVLLEELVSIYEIPVYVLGVLPSADESDQRAWCAARAIRTFVPMADAVLGVDNEAWHTDESYNAVNKAVATRIISLFGAGEREGLPLSELRMDPNDINRTLDVGGVSTIGYAKTELSIEPDGWLQKLRGLFGGETTEPEPQTDATTIKKLVERAVDSKLTLPCDISTVDRVLLILSGPPRELSRKGFETGRSLLEDKTGTVEILAGDEPDTEATTVTATVLLSNVTGVPRIEQLQQRAVAYQTDAESTPAVTHEIDSNVEVDTEGAVEANEEADNGREADAESDPEAAETSDDSDAAVDEHGFRFTDKETVKPTELIDEAEPTTDEPPVDDSTDSSDAETPELSENEPTDDSDSTKPSEDADDSDADPNIKDPFAGGSATSDPSQ